MYFRGCVCLKLFVTVGDAGKASAPLLRVLLTRALLNGRLTILLGRAFPSNLYPQAAKARVTERGARPAG